MSATVNALADLRVALTRASEVYFKFARRDDAREYSGFLYKLSEERQYDAALLVDATERSEMPNRSIFDDTREVDWMLSLVDREPASMASVAYRLQRTENTLVSMTDQLIGLAIPRTVKSALESIKGHISMHRKRISEMRRSLRSDHATASTGAVLDYEEADGQLVQVFFATDRKPVRYNRFGVGRSDDVTHGRCSVFVPKNRKMGSIDADFWAWLSRGNQRVTLKSTEVMGASSFWNAVGTELNSLEDADRHALIFVHGYNTNFEDAARRTAQLKVDLNHAGPAAFYSWPSNGKKRWYTGDEAAVEGSEQTLKAFLCDFATQSGAKAIHIIAHSMGNRALLRAVHEIALQPQLLAHVKFGQIILAAPDVDAGIFKKLAKAYNSVSGRTTLYLSENDKALGISRHLHNYPRVGLAPPVTVISGLDTVNASDINLDFLGHGYAMGLKSVLADIHELIRHNTAPAKRFALRAVTTGQTTHWEFKK